MRDQTEEKLLEQLDKSASELDALSSRLEGTLQTNVLNESVIKEVEVAIKAGRSAKLEILKVRDVARQISDLILQPVREALNAVSEEARSQARKAQRQATLARRFTAWYGVGSIMVGLLGVLYGVSSNPSFLHSLRDIFGSRGQSIIMIGSGTVHQRLSSDDFELPDGTTILRRLEKNPGDQEPERLGEYASDLTIRSAYQAIYAGQGSNAGLSFLMESYRHSLDLNIPITPVIALMSRPVSPNEVNLLSETKGATPKAGNNFSHFYAARIDDERDYLQVVYGVNKEEGHWPDYFPLNGTKLQEEHLQCEGQPGVDDAQAIKLADVANDIKRCASDQECVIFLTSEESGTLYLFDYYISHHLQGYWRELRSKESSRLVYKDLNRRWPRVADSQRWIAIGSRMLHKQAIEDHRMLPDSDCKQVIDIRNMQDRNRGKGEVQVLVRPNLLVGRFSCDENGNCSVEESVCDLFNDTYRAVTGGDLASATDSERVRNSGRVYGKAIAGLGDLAGCKSSAIIRAEEGSSLRYFPDSARFRQLAEDLWEWHSKRSDEPRQEHE